MAKSSSSKKKQQQQLSAWRFLFGGCLGGAGGAGGSGGNKVRPGPRTTTTATARHALSPAPSSSPAAAGLQQRLSVTDVMSTCSDQDLSVSLVGSNLHVFTVGDLKAATQGFVDSNFLGEGGFGPVYKGAVAEGAKPGLRAQQIAVKLWDPEGTQGHKEWLSEVIFLGQLRHPNLVKLVGYCSEEEHRLLVYEYMPKGSLENHLFKKFPPVLSWSTRLNIAVGAAKGLAFLHDAEKPVIYRDFKTSNILLNPDYEAKLSDFGLAKDGPEGDDTHVSTRVMGTHGYAAPEYILTGHLTAKSDVYSFGVVLLEILSGRRAVDKTRPSREQHLVEYMRSWLKDPQKLGRVMDPDLEGKYSTVAAHKAALVAYQCLSGSPKNRPDMSKVVEDLEPLLTVTDDAPGELPAAAPEDVKKERAKRRDGDRREKGRQDKAARSPKRAVPRRRAPGRSQEFWEWKA
ncbi:hypothetical protein SEVIR_9G374900v4 [Setaria viridis]|uniref:non-specific serine/threonine protein kinase n=2 Tax=Setaria TaxID=4554 RepID=K4A9R3_SETIT|nr:serine/threonine-protein kinase RIPK [Setaria italica]XP_034576659.1 serine/threonine-protein kinase RIPK-like [Setaria viridis]RCV44383.1 hypothetical protein SETIT_9G369200v2 [Setaria italica]TKV95613.1 hypothetical protein SEVIR_9G374900v2 [Setaria viridis]